MSKKVVITGATKGIGRAIAETFVKAGYSIALNSRSEEDLQSCKEALLKLNPEIEVLTMPTDMSKKEHVLRFSEFVQQHWNNIDVLINNAGMFIPGMLTEEEDGALEQMINTNLYSAYHLTRALIGNMTKQGSGHIFNMCSIASKIAYPNGGSYSISKFALLGFSKVLREEMKDKGVKVTSILPGATWSASWAGVDLPESRLMQAQDIADAVLSIYQLGDAAVVEEIILRPQLGDL